MIAIVRGAMRASVALALAIGAGACDRPAGAPIDAPIHHTSSATTRTATAVPSAHGRDGSADSGDASHAKGATDAAPFEECAAARGLRFTWRSGHDRHPDRFLNPEIVGGGAALIDHDGDGDLDVYFVQGGDLAPAHSSDATTDIDRLFRNDGPAGFVDVTVEAGLGDPRYGMGAAVGDYDNDGDSDLYVTNLGRNTLYRNDGGRFVDVTDMAGVGDHAWSTSAAFVDIDADGDLDLYVCNYVNWSAGNERDCRGTWNEPDYCSPSAYRAPAQDTLYRNRGDGTFEDATAALGIDAALGNSLGVSVGDFDGDGRIDIFVANDASMNHLWMQGADGRFRDAALPLGVATDEGGQVKAGMGIGNADVDDDGDLDLLVVNLQRETDSFFRNEGRFFADRTASVRLTALSRAFTRFGAGFVDCDNDGRLDLYESSGRVQRQADLHSDDPYAEPNLLYRGTGEGSQIAFQEWHPRGGTTPPLAHASRAAVFGDLDNDGGVDVIVVNRDAPAYLLRNVVPDRGHWLLLRVLDEHGRDALGATVRVRVGDRELRRDVSTAYSYCASNDPRVHFGLGEVDRVESIEVRWVDGTIEMFPGIEADRVATVARGQGSRR